MGRAAAGRGRGAVRDPARPADPARAYRRRLRRRRWQLRGHRLEDRSAAVRGGAGGRRRAAGRLPAGLVPSDRCARRTGECRLPPRRGRGHHPAGRPARRGRTAGPGHRHGAVERTPADRALVELCRQLLATGTLPEVRGERPQVRVSIELLVLCSERGVAGVGGGELAFAGPISPETARRLACDASVVRVITGPDGLPLDCGRTQRTATAAIRRAVELRDGHCVFAGCTAPAAWCDVHHVVHWAYGGPTSCENGALLCERHHTAVHEGRFSVARDSGTAVWHTYRPDGSEIVLPRRNHPLRL